MSWGASACSSHACLWAVLLIGQGHGAMELTRTMVCWSKHATHRRTPLVAGVIKMVMHLLEQSSSHFLSSVLRTRSFTTFPWESCKLCMPLRCSVNVSLMSLAGAGRGPAGLDKRPWHPGGRLHPAHRGPLHDGLLCAAVQLPPLLQGRQLPGHLHAGVHRHRARPAQSCGKDTSQPYFHMLTLRHTIP